MHIGLIGVSYKSSDLELRERFVKASEYLLLEEFRKSSEIFLVLIATCNRTEIYFTAEDLTEAHSSILSELKRVSSFPFEDNLYSFFGERCFNHLAKVTAGIDSVIFGEAEIQRQVKEAYERACFLQVLPSCIHYLFQKSLKIGKEIRTLFALPKGQVSMESTIADLIRYFFGPHKELSILFIGYSEINRKIASFLSYKKLGKLSLVTRSEAAVNGQKEEVLVLPWQELGCWSSYDVVIAASQSEEFLVTPSQILERSSLRNRLVLDLGLPRNVDPALERHPLITLFNIEEMNEFIVQRQKGSLQEKERIIEVIEEAVSLQVRLYQNKTKKIMVCA
jgi:glutamyl-tRNA reductase